MRSPIVSVVVPFYNAADYLADALQSVQGQTLHQFECLMIDDASTDSSRSIAQSFVEADPRFKLLNSSYRQGVSASRNAALKAAEGRWIALLDADDLYLSHRLERLTHVGDEENADLVFDDQILAEYPKRLSERRAFGFARGQFVFTQEDFFTGSRLFLKSFPVGYMKPIIRRTFVDRIGGAYDPSVASGEDFLFYAHLFSAKPHCIAVSLAGYVYRRRRGSVSRSDDHLHFQAGLSDRVLAEYGPDLSERSRSALAARRHDFEDIARALPALSALRERQWKPFAAILARRPGIAATLVRLARTRLIRNLSVLLR